MATKNQLKEYFKSQKIPTEAQFGTFIDSTFLLPKNQVDKTIQFGNGDESGKPHLRAYRHVRKNETVLGKNYRIDYHMFLTLDGVDVNCPVFVIKTNYNLTDETSETRFGEFTDMNESSGAGIDFFDETDEECIAILEGISYYKFAKANSFDNGNPNPRTITDKPDPDTDDTYTVFPAKYGNKWYIGYVIKQSYNFNIDTYKKGIVGSGIDYTDLEFDNSDDQLLIALKSNKITYSNL